VAGQWAQPPANAQNAADRTAARAKAKLELSFMFFPYISSRLIVLLFVSRAVFLAIFRRR
jgi:hypothetical protein